MNLIRLTHAKIINCMSFFVKNLCTYSNTHSKTIENSVGKSELNNFYYLFLNNINSIDLYLNTFKTAFYVV